MNTSDHTPRALSPWHAAAAVALAATLAACGPSSQPPAPYADAGQQAVPTQQPTEVSPPPTAAPQVPTAAVPQPRVDVAPKPAPIQSPAPQRVVQAPPAVIATPAPVHQRVVQQEVKPVGQFGRVTSIQTLRSEAHSNGTGAVIGGVLGGVLGHQIGGGNGRTAATAIGAVGGAVVGNNVEKNRSRDVIGYRVNVQLDNGNTRTVTVNTLDGLSQGDRVRYADGRLFHA